MALTSQLQHSCDAVVLYGTDDGEIQHTFNQLKQTLNSIFDNIQFLTLSKDLLKKEPYLATDEANAPSLISSKRVLIISEDTSFSGPSLSHFLENKKTDAFLIIFGGNLSKSNVLRILAENDPRVLAIACYQPSLQDVQKTVLNFLAAAHKKILPDALDELCQKIPFNQQIIEKELEKLVLYLGDEKQVSTEVIQNCLTNSAEASLDDLCIHLADGKIDAVQRDVALFLASEESETTLLWAVRDYFEKLLLIISDSTASLEQVVDKHLRPAQFALKKPLIRQAKVWNTHSIISLLDKLAQLEQRTRTTILPNKVIIAQAFLSLAQQAHKLAGLR